MKIASILAVVMACLFITGCPAQVPPSPPPTVSVTWTAGNPCNSCTYVVSRCTAAAGATSCPSYTPLNQAAPVAATSYTDSTPPTGVSVLYIIQEVQGGMTGQPSPPSNLIAISVYPGTPGTPNATAQAALAPPILTEKQQQLATSGQVCAGGSSSDNPPECIPGAIYVTAHLLTK